MSKKFLFLFVLMSSIFTQAGNQSSRQQEKPTLESIQKEEERERVKLEIGRGVHFPLERSTDRATTKFDEALKEWVQKDVALRVDQIKAELGLEVQGVIGLEPSEQYTLASTLKRDGQKSLHGGLISFLSEVNNFVKVSIVERLSTHQDVNGLKKLLTVYPDAVRAQDLKGCNKALLFATAGFQFARPGSEQERKTLQVMGLLLDHGASRDSVINRVAAENAEGLKLLLQRLPQGQLKDLVNCPQILDETTPLQSVVHPETNRVNMPSLKILLEAGADPNKKGYCCRNALYWVIFPVNMYETASVTEQEVKRAVLLLLQYGADPDAQDSSGVHVADAAKQKDYNEVAELLTRMIPLSPQERKIQAEVALQADPKKSDWSNAKSDARWEAEYQRARREAHEGGDLFARGSGLSAARMVSQKAEDRSVLE